MFTGLEKWMAHKSLLNLDLFFNWVIPNMYLYKPDSQPAITCSKLTIETLEQGMKYVQS